MRTPLLTLAICLTCFLALAQIRVGQQQGLPYRDTSKRITSMHTTRYKASMVNGKIVKGDIEDEIIFFYDKHGILVKRFIVYPDNRTEKVNSTAERLYHTFNDSARVSIKPVYDERGNLTELPHDPLYYALSGTFKYNQRNQLTELKQIDPENTFNRIQTFTYNADNKLSERTEKNFGGTIIEKTTFDYDKAGRLVQIINSGANHIASRTKLIYDNISGKLMHLVLIGDDNDPPIQYSYEYDTKDRKAKIYVISGNSKRLYSNFKYDALGEGYTYTENNQDKTIVQTIAPGSRTREVFDDSRPISIQQWTFDKHNNIIYQTDGTYSHPPQKIELSNMSVTENQIKYRGGIFDDVANWFRAKKYPPRAGGL